MAINALWNGKHSVEHFYFLRENADTPKNHQPILISLAQMICDGGAEKVLYSHDHGYNPVGTGVFAETNIGWKASNVGFSMMEHLSNQSGSIGLCQWNSFESNQKPSFVSLGRGFSGQSLSA